MHATKALGTTIAKISEPRTSHIAPGRRTLVPFTYDANSGFLTPLAFVLA
jgi:hypothetical protein